MIKNILKTVRGFSPVELVIMVGFGALAAAALIFLATSPQYMASNSQPVNINVKVDGAASVSSGASKAAAKLTPDLSSRQASAMAVEGDDNPDPVNIDGNAGDQMITVYPTGDAPVGNISTDMTNIGWAVNNVAKGGTVLLKATAKGTNTFRAFQFPEIYFQAYWFQVEIVQNLTLTGEILSNQTFSNYQADLDGTPIMTTIEGGYAVIAAFAEHVVVKDLVVKGARDLGFGSYMVVDPETWEFDFDAEAYHEFNNIKMVDMIYPGDWTLIPFFSHTKGKFVVKNCIAREHPDNDYSEIPPVIHAGITYAGGYQGFGENADVEFTNNDVVMASSPFGSMGIATVDNFSLSSATVRNELIKNNSVVADYAFGTSYSVANVQIVDNPAPGGKVIARQAGIVAHDPTPDIPGATSARVNVKGNKVEIDNTDSLVESWLTPFTAGFVGAAVTSWPLIDEPITFLSNAVVSNNTFTGTANYAVYMGDHPWGIPNEGANNTFFGNNISNLSLEAWDMYGEDGNVIATIPPSSYFFGDYTSGNTVAGNTGGTDYVYPGGSNTITGPGLPKDGGIAIGKKVDMPVISKPSTLNLPSTKKLPWKKK